MEYKIFKMNKSIKSGVRKMLFCMISKFNDKQEQHDAVFKQKQDCLHVVLNFLENLEDVAGVDEIVRTIENLTKLEHRGRIKTQAHYLEDIASITGVSISTLKRIKN